MTQIINLTPHAITLRTPHTSLSGESTDHVFESAGVARVTSTPGQRELIDGVPVPVFGRDSFGEVIDLPAPADGVFYVVSGMVGAALNGSRNDVLVPGTGPKDNAIRNEAGHIVAVTCLKRA